MRITKTLILASAFLILTAGIAQAQLDIPMTGIQTFDALGDADNTVLNNDVSPSTFINGVAWTAVDGGSIGGSWGSEAAAAAQNTAQTEGVLFAFFPQNSPCDPCGPVSAAFDSSTQTVLPFPIADNNLRVEFYESYVDVTGSPSFLFSAGTLSFTHSTVPVELMSFTVN